MASGWGNAWEGVAASSGAGGGAHAGFGSCALQCAGRGVTPKLCADARHIPPRVPQQQRVCCVRACMRHSLHRLHSASHAPHSLHSMRIAAACTAQPVLPYAALHCIPP